MGMIPCRCGHTISTVMGPCQDAFRLVSEAKIETFRETGLTGDDVASEIFLNSVTIYICPKCERFLVGWEPNQYRYYKPDP
jgi:hypothetical protein